MPSRARTRRAFRSIAAALAFFAAACAGDPRSGGPDTGVVPDGGGDADSDIDTESDLDLDADIVLDSDEDVDHDDDRPCPANGDGRLERAEVVVSFDLAVLYRAPPSGRTVPVDLAGAVEDAVRTWHFEEPVADERVVEEAVGHVRPEWVARAFPSATYLASLSEQYATSGVFRLDDDALLLLGVVSDSGQSTLVTYDPPVPVLRFPVSEGDTWTVTTSGSGRMSWVPFWDTEEYTFTADAAGVVVVPAGRFPVIRVRTELTQTVGLVVTRRISYGFFAECWGRVAQVVSRDGERELEFSTAADYRRLTFE
jgi:hypothetical protein